MFDALVFVRDPVLTTNGRLPLKFVLPFICFLMGSPALVLQISIYCPFSTRGPFPLRFLPPPLYQFRRSSRMERSGAWSVSTDSRSHSLASLENFSVRSSAAGSVPSMAEKLRTTSARRWPKRFAPEAPPLARGAQRRRARQRRQQRGVTSGAPLAEQAAPSKTGCSRLCLLTGLSRL